MRERKEKEIKEKNTLYQRKSFDAGYFFCKREEKKERGKSEKARKNKEKIEEKLARHHLTRDINNQVVSRRKKRKEKEKRTAKREDEIAFWREMSVAGDTFYPSATFYILKGQRGIS